MKIRVRSEGRRFTIRIPTAFIANPLSASVLVGAINRKREREQPLIPAETARALAKELRACKKRFPGWVLVEVQTPEEYVEIKI